MQTSAYAIFSLFRYVDQVAALYSVRQSFPQSGNGEETFNPIMDLDADPNCTVIQQRLG